ncbi:MAG: flavodoxin [Chloroflexota bacterium]
MKPHIDTSDPRYIILNAGTKKGINYVEEIDMWRAEWQRRMDKSSSFDTAPFGVIYVYASHEPEAEEEKDEEEESVEETEEEESAERQRNEELENAFTASLAKFRREERERTNQIITGYVGVYRADMGEERLERAKKSYDKVGRYNYGVRGNFFQDVESAKMWLNAVTDLNRLPLDTAGADGDTNTSTAIFYGSSTGSTELLAEQVQSAWSAAHDETPPIVNVGDISELSNLLEHDRLLIGIPTWNIGKMQDDWEIVYPLLDEVNLADKQIAIFGVGDQYGYPENFQDAMGILGRKLQERGAKLVGYTSTDGYEHEYSDAIQDGRFMGLAIDDVNQPDLTAGRIEQWVSQVQQEWHTAE